MTLIWFSVWCWFTSFLWNIVICQHSFLKHKCKCISDQEPFICLLLNSIWRLHVQSSCAAAWLPAAEEPSDHRGASWDQPPCFLCSARGRRYQSCSSFGQAAWTGVHTAGQWNLETPVITYTSGRWPISSEQNLTLIKQQQRFWTFQTSLSTESDSCTQNGTYMLEPSSGVE